MPGHGDFPSVMVAEMGVLSGRCVLAFVCVCSLWDFCRELFGCRVTSIMTDLVLSRPLRADMPGHGDFPSVMVAEMGV